MPDLANWQPPERPPYTAMQGRLTRLESITDRRHFDDLWQTYATDTRGAIWTYLPIGPFAGKADFLKTADTLYLGEDPMFHAVIDRKSGKPLGVASLMRINPEQGTIEIGHICYSPPLQRTVMATEAFYLFASRVFDELGYRRFEWKCNAQNAASRRAASRLGFTFEGIFRQHMVVKGKNRDTAWYSILDNEWPSLKRAFEAWLSPENFDNEGNQIKALDQLKERTT